MLIYTLLFLLISSFSIHILSIILYINSKSNKSFNTFVSTLVSNMVLALGLAIFALQQPEYIRNLDIKFIMWILSGFIMVIMLAIKITIFRNINKRMKDPEFYHLNYFGKKVYEEGIVKKSEFLGFMVTLPFFLFLGAYFVAKLVFFLKH